MLTRCQLLGTFKPCMPHDLPNRVLLPQIMAFWAKAQMTIAPSSSLGPLPQPQAPHKMTPPTTYLAPIANHPALNAAKTCSSHHLTHHRSTLSMHADTLRPPRACGCIKIDKCQLKTELTTASFDPEACSSPCETCIRKAFVGFGHHLVHPPAPSDESACRLSHLLLLKVYRMQVYQVQCQDTAASWL